MLILVGWSRHKGWVDCSAEDVVVFNKSSSKFFFQNRRPVVVAVSLLELASVTPLASASHYSQLSRRGPSDRSLSFTTHRSCAFGLPLL